MNAFMIVCASSAISKLFAATLLFMGIALLTGMKEIAEWNIHIIHLFNFVYKTATAAKLFQHIDIAWVHRYLK